jgi:predicted ATPase/DNA-binding winged helix-turn-helix (wHTH) protein
VLIPLVAAGGEPVAKNAVMAAAWQDRVVEPNNLTVQIATLRRVLQNASGEIDGFIRTRSGEGYVFTQPVERIDTAERAVRAVETTAPVPAEPGPHDVAALTEPLTNFIGRTAEVAELAKLLTARPLVTITGLGGVGKTRLALRVRQILADSYRDGVVFVDLPPLADPPRVADAAGTRALLILDNAEHLRDVVAAMARLILERCRGVSVLVTSREMLGLSGEQVFRLQPLALPPGADDGHAGITGADAMAYDAVRLFADRAAALLPGFRVDDGNAGDIVAICHRLDGIALALEMAVPRLEVLTPRQLVERLRDRFRPLSSARQDVLPRQRTLRTMFDWSWELLQPEERALVQRLAVFAGGASLGALTRLEDTDETEWDVLDWLTSLAQKSLVIATAPAPAVEPRYRLLEMTRQYALGRLDPGQLAPLRRRHAERMAAIFEQAEAEWPTLDGATWLARYGPDVDNLRGALEWAFQSGGSGGPETADQGDDALGVRLVAASGSLWWELPSLPLRESHRWHKLAVARMPPDTPLAIQGRVWMGESWKDIRKGDEENYPAAARKSLALLRARDGEFPAAARLLGCGEAFHPATPPFGPRHPVIRATKDLVAAARGAAQLAAWMAEGAAWSEEDALAAARSALGI